MPAQQKIALLGTGAIGASIARALYLNQIPFTILVRDKKRKADLLAQGIRYTLKGTTHIQLNQGAEVLTLAEAQQSATRRAATRLRVSVFRAPATKDSLCEAAGLHLRWSHGTAASAAGKFCCVPFFYGAHIVEILVMIVRSVP
jgi:3-hydroxyacyl-CoA dehydrogenase